MPDVRVHFVHPTNGTKLTATLDSGMTVEEVVGELVANSFIPSSMEGYSLAIKGGDLIGPGQSMASAGVKAEDTIRVLPSTDAGR
jgi:hypothetical protein